MNKLLSPRQVAQVLGVSESSVKRWCDGGQIPTEYTARGHRRIPVGGLRDFMAASGRSVAEADALGLVLNAERRSVDLPAAAECFFDAITRGERAQADRIVTDLAYQRAGLPEVCDQVIAPAMHRIGERWEVGRVSVYQERRACGVVHGVIATLRQLCRRPADDAPRAVGASASGDQYSIPNAMAELVLSDCGWRADSLGENLPLSEVADAARDSGAGLVWISCATIADVDAFVGEFARLRAALPPSVRLVVGGRALGEDLRKRLDYTFFCDTMRHLRNAAEGLAA